MKDERVAALVTDNEPTMNAMGLLAPFPWVGCIDHLIELTTGIAFEGPGVKAAMASARALVGSFLSSNQQLRQLYATQRALDPTSDEITIQNDIITRWWSTYNMVFRLVILKTATNSLAASGAIARTLTDEEWGIVEYISIVLRPFMVMQEFFEGTKYVTISFVPKMVHKMRRIVENLAAGRHADDLPAHISAGARQKAMECGISMRDQFRVRWGSGEPGTVFTQHQTRGPRRIAVGLPYVTMIATACDPRTKRLPGIPEEDKRHVWSAVVQELTKEYKKVHPQEHVEAVDAGQQDGAPAAGAPVAGARAAVGAGAAAGAGAHGRRGGNYDIFADDDEDGDDGDEDGLQPLSYDELAIEAADMELKSYRRIQQVVHTSLQPVDPLAWWKSNSHLYPLMARLAKRTLCIPAASASSERLFSTAGNVVTKKRVRLDPSMASTLVFLKGVWTTIENIEADKATNKKARLT